MSRSLVTASSLRAISLAAASVASGQRPVGRPGTEPAAAVRRPAPNPGHPVTPATPAKTLTTPTYGDVNNFPSRIQAGSRSDKGGLKTGDTFPAGDSSTRHEAARADGLPLLIWEGELRTGQNGVAIAPVVWELDEDDVLRSPLNGVGEAAKEYDSCVIELRYRDAEDLKGDCSVFVQIERAP